MKRKIFFVILICIFAVGGVTALAKQWETVGATKNHTSLASVKGLIEEEYVQESLVYPGGTVEKVSRVKNIGTVPAVVRVNVTKKWNDDSLDVEKVLIDFDNETWVKRDNYWYYKKVLMPGDKSDPLTFGFSLSESVGNNYAGKIGNIVLNMEMVQAQGGPEIWEVEDVIKDSEMSDYNLADIVTSIDFQGGKTGFVFKENNGDLFYAFKNMVPGQVVSQIVKVKNSSKEQTEIFLWAEKKTDDYDEKSKIAMEFLNNYSKITIVDEEGNSIYSGPLMTDHEEDLLNVSLGSFDEGQEKNFIVNLQLSSEMDNDYEGLATDIEWKVKASGEEAMIPETGDSKVNLGAVIINVSVCFMLLTILGLVFTKLFNKKKK